MREGEALNTLATVIGCAVHLADHSGGKVPEFTVRETLRRLREGEHSGGSREILDNLRQALTIGLPPMPPKGGTHLRLVASNDPTVLLRAAG